MNTSPIKEKCGELDNSSFFCEDGRKPLSLSPSGVYEDEEQKFSQSELNRIMVFRCIEKIQPTTRYRISKEIRLDKTTIRLIVRDLVFSGVVHEDNRIGDNSKQYKILTIPGLKNKNNIPSADGTNPSARLLLTEKPLSIIVDTPEVLNSIEHQTSKKISEDLE